MLTQATAWTGSGRAAARLKDHIVHFHFRRWFMVAPAHSSPSYNIIRKRRFHQEPVEPGLFLGIRGCFGHQSLYLVG